MKRAVLLSLVLAFAMAGISQNHHLKSGLKTNKAPRLKTENQQTSTYEFKDIIPGGLNNTDVVTCVNLGTAANAYGYGLGISAGKGSLLQYNAELNTIVFIHRMGGDLDPGGFSGNIAYDISTDGGENWSLMNMLYAADDTAGGGYYLDAARYPQGGIYNPTGNTNPNDAFVAWEACVNDNLSFNGIVFGRGNIGNPADTSINYYSSNPGPQILISAVDAFTIDNSGHMWGVSTNMDWEGGSLNWLEELVVTTFVWDETEDDFMPGDQFLLDCPSEYPADIKIEFSPDGTFGYIAILGNIPDMPGVDQGSYYPIIWRTEDAGQNWEGPIKVSLAESDGIYGVQQFLSDEELAELYDPVPPRDEIPFTTAIDFDLTVDEFGNPHIAVIVGVTGEDAFSIITEISPSSGYMYTAAFLLSSNDQGTPFSWSGGLMGRPLSFRGYFEDLSEDNRIQITRSPEGDKVFVSWIDTDPDVSFFGENDRPDIWCRGVNLTEGLKTTDENGDDKPNNVTYGSEATFASYFFTAANMSMVSPIPGYDESIIPFVYLNMTMDPFTFRPIPSEPVQFKYIKDFQYQNDAFTVPAYLTTGIEGSMTNKNRIINLFPNPASTSVSFEIIFKNPTSANISVSNYMGQMVRNVENYKMTEGRNKVTMDVSGLEAGVYFIIVETGGDKVSGKLVVE